jgi:hypothetical protein
MIDRLLDPPVVGADHEDGAPGRVLGVPSGLASPGHT